MKSMIFAAVLFCSCTPEAVKLQRYTDQVNRYTSLANEYLDKAQAAARHHQPDSAILYNRASVYFSNKAGDYEYKRWKAKGKITDYDSKQLIKSIEK